MTVKLLTCEDRTAMKGLEILAWSVVCALQWQQLHPGMTHEAVATYVLRLLSVEGASKATAKDCATVALRLLKMRQGRRTLDLFKETPFWSGPLKEADSLSSFKLADGILQRLHETGVGSIWKLRRARWLDIQAENC